MAHDAVGLRSARNNMYTVTMQDETESDFIEDLFCQHEASCSPALAETIASCCLPIGETRLLVLDFLALLALRSPAAFDTHTALLNGIAYKWLKGKTARRRFDCGRPYVACRHSARARTDSGNERCD